MTPFSPSLTSETFDARAGLVGDPSGVLLPPEGAGARVVTYAADLAEAQALANLCEQFLRLTRQEHMTVTGAARLLGQPASLFSGARSVLARYLREGLAGLQPRRRLAGAKPRDLTAAIEAIPWFLPAARFFYLNTNRDAEHGSVPEAVRLTLSLPHLPIGWHTALRHKFLAAIQQPAVPACPADLREQILARQSAGLPLVTGRIAKAIAAPPAIVRLHRSPGAWALDTLSAPGSQRRYFDAATGQRQIMQPGDWFGGDDATPGIAVCVPCAEVITPTSQRYGVLLGRFQWLAYHDARTDKILAWDYVVRPRGSYRAEDVVNGIGAVTRVHGVPRKGWQLEGGTFHARLVRECIQLLGCEHWRTYSPHQKAIESIFNRVWTRLAIQFPHADMGRYRSENEANCALYEACKRGHQDPRKYFPTIDLVVAAFTQEVQAHNTRRIESEQYGQWVPDALFQASIERAPLRPFSPEMDWIFSPFSVERKVRGMLVRCRVPMFEDFSVPFEFHAPWMPLHNGKTVRLHFDPRQPRCTAKVILLEGSGQHRAGEILGDAQLIGETSGHIRLIMGWAQDDQRAGYLARQRTAQFLRRETRAIGGSGRPAYAASEQRDGVGAIQKIQISHPGDGVPNAGDANNGPQAGTGEPPDRAPFERQGSATVVNAPLSQSPSRAGMGPQPSSDHTSTSTQRRQLQEQLAEFERNHAHLFD